VSTNLLTAEGVAFRSKVNVRLHPHDLAAIDAARGTSLERADWVRWALRKALHDAGVPPYGEVHHVEQECPICREPAALMGQVLWNPGAPEAGILPRWQAFVDVWSSEESQNPLCGCDLHESDILSARERAVEQFEARLLSGEARENGNAKE
jgi:hypothetical protein